MTTMTKYVGWTEIIEELVMNPTADPCITILAGSIIFLWGVRLTFAALFRNTQMMMTPLLTPELIDQLRGLDLFKEEFLLGLIPGHMNPITPTLMDYLKRELAVGDRILYDTGIHTIFGDTCPSLEVVIQELTLIAPTLPF